MLEKKYMNKETWRRVIKREYTYKNLEDCNGVISLLHLKELTSPCFKEYGNEKIKIADNGYWWLQLGISEENWWLTVMYDENMKLIQYYFDITNKNNVTENEEASFEDMFLDVIILQNGGRYLLDEAELKEALEKGEISQKQYNTAYCTANKIIHMSKEKEKELYDFCYEKLKKLKEKINI